MKVNIEHQENETPIKNEEEFDTRLDAIKFTSIVHSRIKKDINSDFIMAILPDKDKTAVIEMTQNAYFAKKIIQTIANNTKENNKKTTIQNIAEKLFDSYMIKIYMTVLMNRNVAKNHLLQLLAGKQEDEETIEENKATDNFVKKLTEKLKSKQ